MERGTTILFVSHDPATIQSLCQRGVLLDKGKVYMIGPAKEVSQEYFKIMLEEANANMLSVSSEQETSKVSFNFNNSKNEIIQCLPEDSFIEGGEEFVRRCAERFGEDIGWIANVKILNSKGEITNKIECRENFLIRVYIKAKKDIESYSIAFRIWDEKGMSLFGTHTILEKVKLPSLKKNNKIIVDFIVENIFAAGKYSITVAFENPVFPPSNHITLDGILGAEYFYITEPVNVLDKTLSKVYTKVKIKISNIEYY